MAPDFLARFDFTRANGESLDGMRPYGTSVFLAVVCALAISARALAQRTESEQVASGERLFASSCQICHGEAGVGNRAPTLRGPRLTVDYVSGVIVTGKPG